MSRCTYDDDEPPEPRRYRYRCGGWASYSGPCGAPDCGSCRNGTPPWEEDDDDTDDDDTDS